MDGDVSDQTLHQTVITFYRWYFFIFFFFLLPGSKYTPALLLCLIDWQWRQKAARVLKRTSRDIEQPGFTDSACQTDNFIQSYNNNTRSAWICLHLMLKTFPGPPDSWLNIDAIPDNRAPAPLCPHVPCWSLTSVTPSVSSLVLTFSLALSLSSWRLWLLLCDDPYCLVTPICTESANLSSLYRREFRPEELNKKKRVLICKSEQMCAFSRYE